jgi:hypothetical protein
MQSWVMWENYEDLAVLSGVPVRDTVQRTAGDILGPAESRQGHRAPLVQRHNCIRDNFVSIDNVRRGGGTQNRPGVNLSPDQCGYVRQIPNEKPGVTTCSLLQLKAGRVIAKRQGCDVL